MVSNAPNPNPDPDSGDGWVTLATGQKVWGRFGASGLLAYDAAREAGGSILLQHRAEWSHHGGTWGMPGGATHRDESPVDGAIREAQEEAGIPDGAVRPRYTHVLDRGGWTYTTVIAETTRAFEPEITDAESIALEWVPIAEVDEFPLHPSFEASWPVLRPLLGHSPAVIVDAANVVGSVPDGWWKDRRGAAEKLRDRVERVAGHAGGIRHGFLRLPKPVPDGLDRAHPDWVMVAEGLAREVEASPHVSVIGAEGHGDDAIVAETRRRSSLGQMVTVITSDRELRVRCEAAGAASFRGSGKFLTVLDRWEAGRGR